APGASSSSTCRRCCRGWPTSRGCPAVLWRRRPPGRRRCTPWSRHRSSRGRSRSAGRRRSIGQPIGYDAVPGRRHTRCAIPIRTYRNTSAPAPVVTGIPARKVRSMQVEVFSDVVCPWCYIGKRHMEEALATFPHADQVTVTYRSYQLSPDSPQHSEDSLAEMLAKKYRVSLEQAQAMNDRVTGVAAEAGLDYQLDQAHPANTFDAHRLLHFAAEHGKQAEMKERLMAAYFTEGKRIGDVDVLVGEAVAVGLDGDAARAA